MSLASSIENKPNINVTPLIDVLLVMLIIFMVAAPLKPFRFEAKLPAPPDDRKLPPGDLTLVVTIEADRTLKLNQLTDMGTVEEPLKLVQTLADLFQQRARNHVYRYEMLTRTDVPEKFRIQKTVFVKAPSLRFLTAKSPKSSTASKALAPIQSACNSTASTEDPSKLMLDN